MVNRRLEQLKAKECLAGMELMRARVHKEQDPERFQIVSVRYHEALKALTNYELFLKIFSFNKEPNNVE